MSAMMNTNYIPVKTESRENIQSRVLRRERNMNASLLNA